MSLPTLPGDAGIALAFLFEHADTILTQLKLLVITLAVLYVSSHASLRRPPSAAPAKKKWSGLSKDADQHDDEEKPSQMEGLQLSDAILFPVMAAVVLIGLYYLIQYLEDPDILNKILQWYISLASLASLAMLYSHVLQLAISFAFPQYWRSGGVIFHISQSKRRQLIWEEGRKPEDQVVADRPLGPLPFGPSTVRLPVCIENFLWGCRGLLTTRWNLEVRIHGIVDEKASFRLHHVVAVLLSAATVMSYHVWMSSHLTNVIGLALCYSSAQYLSPTCFKTGYSLLGGLFIYDIVMVFYTPYMITVATKLEAPMKITVQTGGRTNILGLGDIVIPCLLVALALRFDLWMHYLGKVEYVPEATPQSGEQDGSNPSREVARSKKYIATRAPYVDVSGRWADWLATVSLIPWKPSPALPAEIAASTFPKPYFYAAMTGYALGMVVTLAMVLIFRHGQPALLYLVPGVVGALCLTAVARGEFRVMMLYNEDGSLDHKCSVVELDDRGKLVKFITAETDEKKGDEKQGDEKKGDEKTAVEKTADKKEVATEEEEEERPEVFLIRISAVGTGKAPRAVKLHGE
ncbi:related to Minor histocompatibility antigen H13 [Cephalotrichum gorgonifer]|uniref:Related to Minor histocompatibility antigen H13 n=1 Tax=Cephalotrichum gorgonifer TaxID=2041049 RepID=A0AAE8N039_9PEZI|nr:related to Minor histocompatibility antigen H13 [Cephalotrichum gorgonifer]